MFMARIVSATLGDRFLKQIMGDDVPVVLGEIMRWRQVKDTVWMQFGQTGKVLVGDLPDTVGAGVPSLGGRWVVIHNALNHSCCHFTCCFVR